MLTPEGYKAEVERHIRTYEEERPKLYRPDGRPFLADDEMREREEMLLDELRQMVALEVQDAEEDIQELEGKLAGLSYQDPTARLTSLERDRLAVCAPLIREELEMMDLPELLERLKAVAASSDMLAKLLHSRYAGFRVKAMKREIEQAGRAGKEPPHSVEESRALREIGSIVEELQDSLEDPERKAEREKASEKVEALREAVSYARRRLTEADGTEQEVMEEMRRRISESV